METYNLSTSTKQLVDGGSDSPQIDGKQRDQQAYFAFSRSMEDIALTRDVIMSLIAQW